MVQDIKIDRCAKHQKTIFLGYQDDQKRAILIFDIADCLPADDFTVWYKCGDFSDVVDTTLLDDTHAMWVLSERETAEAGAGELQFRFSADGRVWHSAIYKTLLKKSLRGGDE